MLSARGVAVFGAGVAMWLTARVLGSPGLEVIAIGLGVLPFVTALLARRSRTKLSVKRRLSEVRVGPGTKVDVSLELTNRSAAPTPMLLLEDRLPTMLGRSARAVSTGLMPRATRNVHYTIVPQSRGRYRLGPLNVELADPLALTRQRIQLDVFDELVVTPAIEDLSQPPDPVSGGAFGTSRATQLFRSGEEFYTMRPYQVGDDLRRIHWPSVARTGRLMIRQDESSRRAGVLVFIDTRAHSIGQSHSPSFERAVSAAASIGVLLSDAGFSLRLATADAPPAAYGPERFLDALAGLRHGTARTIGPALVHLRAGASPDTTLVLVGAAPAPTELATIVRAASGFGAKLAVFVYPVDPAGLPPDRQAQVEGRATQARLAMARGGWDCLFLTPTGSLAQRWHAPRDRLLVSSV